jgi:amino acid transporter
LSSALNVLAVKAYGEAEFWLSGGKVILIMIVFSFTFITMVGGNPEHDAYGFRYWKNPGAFKEYRTTGSIGRFEGFLAALWSASFTVVGPEYISMVAAEAKRPRIYIKNAFKTVYIRFGIFFIGGALAVGIVCASNDKTLTAIFAGTAAGSGTASASPYVIAMQNLKINGLPHLVNALLVTSIFSAGNTYTYAATRSLYGLALEGRAPKFLRYCTKSGVPVFCFAVVMCFPCLSYLQLGSGSAVVLNWFVSNIAFLLPWLCKSLIVFNRSISLPLVVLSTTLLCAPRTCTSTMRAKHKALTASLFRTWVVSSLTVVGLASGG